MGHFVGLIYTSVKSKWSSKKKVHPYSKVKRDFITSVAIPHIKPFVRETSNSDIPSHSSNGYACGARKEDKVYTGDKMIGIGTLHKSNAVPVFCNDEAVAMAKMRRG